MARRQAQASRLRAALDATGRTPGSSRVLLVEGGMGIGKTSLLTTAAAAGFDVVLARADRLTGGSPLSVARSVLEHLDPGVAVGADESVRDLARRAARVLDARPVPIVVDDAQWLDPASAEFLQGLLLGRVTTWRTLVLAHRTGRPPLSIIDIAHRVGADVEHLQLEPLPDEDIAAIAADLPAWQGAEVVAGARGNPLFASVLSALFRRRPELATTAEALRADPADAGAALYRAVAADLAQLDGDETAALEAVAVLDSLDVAALAVIADREEERVSAQLGRLRSLQLLSQNPGEAIHPVIRSSVYHAIPPDRAVRAHRRAAALPGLAPYQRAEHLAMLREHASAAEIDRLVELAEPAIGTDPGAVRRWLEPTRQHRVSPRRDLLLARALVLDGRPDDAADLLEPLLTDSAADAAEARSLLAQAWRASGRTAEAHRLLAEAPLTEPATLIDAAALAALAGEIDTVRDTVDRLAGSPPQFQLAGRALRAVALLGSGDIAAARRALAGVPDALRALGDDRLRDILDACAAAVWSAYLLDDFHAAIALGERALWVAQRHGRGHVLANLGAATAHALASVGRLSETDELGEQAVADAERYQTPDPIPMARHAQVLAAFWADDPALLRRRFDQLRAAPSPGVEWWRRATRSTRARIAAVLGEPEPYAVLLPPPDVAAGLRHADAATVAALGGDQATAQHLLAAGLDHAERHRLRSQGALLRLLTAMLVARPARDWPRAAELAEQAVDEFSALGMSCHLRLARQTAAEITRDAAASPAGTLTRRELEIARLVADGLSNQQIADRLVISRRTVEEHVSKVLRKLDVSSRAAVRPVLHS